MERSLPTLPWLLGEDRSIPARRADSQAMAGRVVMNGKAGELLADPRIPQS